MIWDSGHLAKERKIRRKITPAQEQRKIERLLGEEFDSLAEARRALKRESKPVKSSGSKPSKKAATPKPSRKSAPLQSATKPATKSPTRFNIGNATRRQKFQYAQKIGKGAYTRRLNEWWDDHPDADPDDNPYCYHSKE